MDAQRNKEVVRRIFEELLPAPTFSEELGALVADDYVDHDAADANRARGVDSLRATHEYLHRRWPGKVAFTIDDLIAEGDKVAVRWSAGDVRAIAWFRLRDGKLVERRAVMARPPETGGDNGGRRAP